MKQRSKSVPHLILSLALLPVVLLSACAGAGDWSFSGLPGDYEVVRFSAHVIRLLERTSDIGGTTVVDSFVSELWWNDDYILAKRKPEDTAPESSVSYYIVEVATKEVFGPYTKEEFDARVPELDIPFSHEGWISVRDLPQDSS